MSLAKHARDELETMFWLDTKAIDADRKAAGTDAASINGWVVPRHPYRHSNTLRRRAPCVPRDAIE